MPNESVREVYRAHREGHSQYIYFILAAAGAGIGLAVNQTRDVALAWTHAPLAAAVVAWGLSFYFGCCQLHYLNSILFQNVDLLQVQLGQHRMVGDDPARMAFAEQFLRDELGKKVDRSARYGQWQFRCLVSGGVLYVAWHAWEMYLRRIAG
jgi:hypothetical protein